MIPKERRAGRQQGTPNKRTLAVVQKLEAFACEAINGMARIPMDEHQPVQVGRIVGPASATVPLPANGRYVCKSYTCN